MSENENVGIESVSDVPAESSPAPETSNTSETPNSSSHAASPQQEKYVPYERFQEIIKEKNEFLKRIEDTERKYQDLHRSFENSRKPAEAPSKEAQLINRLKGIDPEFGSWAEQMQAQRQQLEELKSWKAQAEQERVRNDAQSTMDRLHAEYKVDPAARGMYQAMIREQAINNPNLGVKDLPNIYRQVHTTISQFLEAQKRSALSTYAEGKKTDSLVPKTAKAPATKAAPGTKFQFSKDPETARAEIVRRALSNKKAEE